MVFLSLSGNVRQSHVATEILDLLRDCDAWPSYALAILDRFADIDDRLICDKDVSGLDVRAVCSRPL